MKRKSLERCIRDRWQLFLLVLPAFTYTLIFDYKPMYGIVIAFQDYKLMKGIAGSRFIGLANFARFFSSYWFPIILKNTLTVSLLSLLVSFPLPIILALMVNEVHNPHAKRLSLPHIVNRRGGNQRECQQDVEGPVGIEWILPLRQFPEFAAGGNHNDTVRAYMMVLRIGRVPAKNGGEGAVRAEWARNRGRRRRAGRPGAEAQAGRRGSAKKTAAEGPFAKKGLDARHKCMYNNSNRIFIRNNVGRIIP